MIPRPINSRAGRSPSGPPDSPDVPPSLLIASADGGTLMLDMVDEASEHLQQSLFRFLQDREVRAVDSLERRPVQSAVSIAPSIEKATPPSRAKAAAKRAIVPVKFGEPPVPLYPVRVIGAKVLTPKIPGSHHQIVAGVIVGGPL